MTGDQVERLISELNHLNKTLQVIASNQERQENPMKLKESVEKGIISGVTNAFQNQNLDDLKLQ